MIKQLRTIFTALLLSSAYFAVAQTSTVLDQTLIKLQKQSTENPVEKVYLHLDKPYYGAGDTIWFKGYIVSGALHNLSALSSVLNIDLIDEHNTIKRTIKLPVISGITYGDFPLPDTLREGSYRIRAYTNWMRNSGPEYFFDKTLAIINGVTNKVFTKANYTYTINNGQQMVNAVINYTDINGKPYADKEVKYIIKLDPQKIASSKGITDDKGDLHVAFTNPSPGILSTGEINTTIQPDNEQPVTKTIVIKATTSKTDVQFFPESGNLVNGIPSKVAFKAVGADGLGADIKGAVTDEQNNEIATFTTTHLGMGAFVMAPEASHTYKATITNVDGSTSVVALPKVMDKGYVMAIDGQSDPQNIKVRIVGSGMDGAVTLVAQTGGKVYLQGKSKPGQPVFTANIPKKQLPPGIMQFTLFSDSGEPLNERLVFIQNDGELKIAVSTPQQSYSSRQKVKIILHTTNKDGQAVAGNFSAAVIDESKVPVDENTESTILSNLLLTSDIKGYIEQPNYYFTNVNEKTQADLDILMLTQGYHRFEWKQVINNTIPAMVYQPEKALSIAGIAKTTGGKPIVNGKVALLSNSPTLPIMDTVTDKNGRFAFNFDYKDSTRFMVRALTTKKAAAEIEFDEAPPIIKTDKYKADILVNVNAGLGIYLQNNKNEYDEEAKYGLGNHTKVLKEVKVKDKPITKRQQEIDNAVQFSRNLNGPGNADQVITAEDIAALGCSRIDCLNGLIIGVHFSPTGSAISTRGKSTFSEGGGGIDVILDGVTLDAETVKNLAGTINMNDVSSIEVLRSGGYTSIYNSFNGAIIITTKHGGQTFGEKEVTPPGFIQPRGYYLSREFYSPQYDNPKTNTQIPDLRSTIYWKPILQTDKSGDTTFEFFNADGKGTYRVVVEGIDYNGNIGRQVYRYKVE